MLLRPLAYPHRQSGGSSQAEGTRTGNHQYRDGTQQGIGEHAPTGHGNPDDKGHYRDADNHRHEDSRHLVDNALHGSLAALRLTHHAHHARQHRIGTRSLHIQHESAPLVEGTGQHPVAGLLGHRLRLAADHALVDIRRPLEQHAIDGYLLAGAHTHPIAGAQHAYGHIAFLAVRVDQPGRLGLQPHERPNRSRSALLGPSLEQLAREHKGDNHRHRLVVDVRHQPQRHPELGINRTEQAEEKRYRGTEHDQRVHVGPPLSGSLPARDVERPAQIEDRQGE